MQVVPRGQWEAGPQVAEWNHWNHALAGAEGRDSNDARARACDASLTMWERFGLPPESLTPGHCYGSGVAPGTQSTVIDVGCGPTARCSCFANHPGIRLVGIDPLAERYRDLPGGLLCDYAELHGVPAEDFIDTLAGTGTLVACVNVLDHCYDPAAVIANMARYMMPHGLAFISCDVGRAASDALHLAISVDEMESAIEAAGLCAIRREHGMSFPCRVKDGALVWQDGWTQDTVAHHWWLVREMQCESA